MKRFLKVLTPVVVALAIAAGFAADAHAAAQVWQSRAAGRRNLWGAAAQTDSASFALEPGTGSACTDTVGPFNVRAVSQGVLNSWLAGAYGQIRINIYGTASAATADSAYGWVEFATEPTGPWLRAAGTAGPNLNFTCGIGTAGTAASGGVGAADPASGKTVYTAVLASNITTTTTPQSINWPYMRVRLRGDIALISGCTVDVAYSIEVPPVSFAGWPVGSGWLGRRNKWGSAAQTDSTSFTLEGVASGTTTYSASDTVGPFYIGDMHLMATSIGTASLPQYYRLNVKGVPSAATVDTLFAWAEYSEKPTGPWFVSQTTIAAGDFLLLPGIGADGTAVGAALTGGNTDVATGNTVAIYSGVVRVAMTSLTPQSVNPCFWKYVRFRLRGDGSDATAGKNSLFGAKAQLFHVASRLPLSMPPGQ